VGRGYPLRMDELPSAERSERLPAAARMIVTGAFFVGLLIMLLDPFSWGRISGLAAVIAGALAVVLAAALGAMALGHGEMPEEEFRRISERSELMSRMPAGQMQPSEFEESVIEAIDELPAEFQDVLRDVPIVISDRGEEFGAYGHYIGDTMARDDFRDHIVIYQDTLERDFGFNQDLLRAQIARTVRHEVAHHLGWDERGVHDLGL
jgi:predicted Zn-dependent protease with MMP-like domain